MGFFHGGWVAEQAVEKKRKEERRRKPRERHVAFYDQTSEMTEHRFYHFFKNESSHQILPTFKGRKTDPIGNSEVLK
jgi:hypothetical protein